MNIIWFALPVSMALGFGFLAAFIWAVRSGQMDDLVTPAHRILTASDDLEDNVERDPT